MKGLIKAKSVKVYTTGDGKDFDDKNSAEKHQAQINLRGFFLPAAGGNDAQAALIAQSILDDIDGFREVLGPLVRKPRGPRVAKDEATEPAKRKAA